MVTGKLRETPQYLCKSDTFSISGYIRMVTYGEKNGVEWLVEKT
jgi:hypothetical protein